MEFSPLQTFPYPSMVLKGYFKCKRDVRQVDPLSSLLFTLVDNYLSKGIWKLMVDGHLDVIKVSMSCKFPSHSLYADDMRVYYKGKTNGLAALEVLFPKYANRSNQCINASKSTFYVRGHISSLSETHYWLAWLQFRIITILLSWIQNFQRKA